MDWRPQFPLTDPDACCTDPGSGGGTGTGGDPYHHDQGTPSALWVVTHNLGRPVAAVKVRDSAGTWHPLAPYDEVSSNVLTIQLASAASGSVDVY